VCGQIVDFDVQDEFDPRRMHMAHIGAKQRFGDDLSNVSTQCGRCHREEHQHGKSRQKPCPKKERE
jgi:cytochrome c553